MKNNFLLCGATGWCLEILWTGFLSLKQRDIKLTGTSSLWMFPIYGAAALFKYCPSFLKKRCFLIRGFVYSILIFTGEYLSGTMLKLHHACPWDYSRAKLNLKGVIRLDYLPLWFLAGLLFERLIQSNSHTEHP